MEWGDLDYLVVDTPPGTSDEHLSIAQYLKGCNVDGAVIVTTPQEISLLDVRKEINFCHKLKIPVIGVVENMSGFVCPNCKNESKIFKPSTGNMVIFFLILFLAKALGGAKGMCDEMNVPFLGSVPIDPKLARSCDEGNFVLAKILFQYHVLYLSCKGKTFCKSLKSLQLLK